MALLNVNGIPIPIKPETLSESFEEIGGRERAYDGTLRISRQARKTNLSFETPVLTTLEAEAWNGLLSGLGHYWSFDSNNYSSKGLGHSSGTALRATSNPLSGAGHLEFSGAQTRTWAQAGLGTRWTVSLWRDSSGAPGGAAYAHYVVRSDGAKWVDGVRNDAASTTWLSVSSGQLALSDTNTDIDEIIAVPYLWDTTWPALVFAEGGLRNALTPTLRLYGDLIPGSSVTAPRFALGEVSEMNLYSGRRAGAAFAATHRSLSVTLSEV